MGLDMYLTGEKFFSSIVKDRPKDDEGYTIEKNVVELGYWRKHANLHGYIVATFAEGKDDCQDIELDMEQLKALLEIVKDPSLMPKTEGFFFGESANDEEQIKEDTEIITKAIGFLSAGLVKQDRDVWRSVHYRASW